MDPGLKRLPPRSVTWRALPACARGALASAPGRMETPDRLIRGATADHEMPPSRVVDYHVHLKRYCQVLWIGM